MTWTDVPAVRTSAARTLRRLQGRRAFEWFLAALNDDHFGINGGCCTVREKFYPVRSIVHLVLRELIDRHASDRVMQGWSGPLEGRSLLKTLEDFKRRMREAKLRQLEVQTDGPPLFLKLTNDPPPSRPDCP